MAKAQTLMTPWINEGFFSNVTVLVEGEEDRAILIGTAAARDIDFDALNISILPCGGKSQVLKAAVIFKALEIATYTIWDSDRDKEDSRPETNRSLLRAMNCEPEDYPLDKVESKYACFTNNFMATIQPEISEFEEFKNEAVTYYSLENWQMARKNPLVLSRILRNAFERSHQSSTADQILDAILERKNSAARGE